MTSHLGADLDFGEDFALMNGADGAPTEFDGYHFAPGRDPLPVYFRERGGYWRFEVREGAKHSGKLLFELSGTYAGYPTFAECVDIFRDCLAQWRATERERSRC